jgi:hypothetical protein
MGGSQEEKAEKELAGSNRALHCHCTPALFVTNRSSRIVRHATWILAVAVSASTVLFFAAVAVSASTVLLFAAAAVSASTVLLFAAVTAVAGTGAADPADVWVSSLLACPQRYTFQNAPAAPPTSAR